MYPETGTRNIAYLPLPFVPEKNSVFVPEWVMTSKDMFMN